MTGFVSQVQTDVGDVKSADPSLVNALANGPATSTQAVAASAAVTPTVAKAAISTTTLLILAVGAYFIFKKK